MGDNVAEYNHKNIETKWQSKWAEDGIYTTSNDTNKPKAYILDMFPYPSGEGLHVGHPRGYIATDIYSRMKRMNGFNVLHPMGWDAFGLPAENFAIKNKVHPSVAVEKNVVRFKEQLSLIGPNYDWSREINTTDPAFYKWTQWIFLQMFKKGLAYESYEPINWCPSCQTGLANEDVEADGTCERCSTIVEKKPMRQWVLKITDYADRLLADLDKLPKWPTGVKEAQRNWIGRSVGSEIEFKIKDTNEKVTIFTTRADTLFGVTYVVLAPEHPFVKDFVLTFESGVTNKSEIEAYVLETKNKSELDRQQAKEKTGVEVKGILAINPANGEELSVWIADYVLAGYGTGAVMAVPAHDERDFEFANKYNLPIKQVIEPILIQNTGSATFRENEPMQDSNGIIAIIKHWSEDKYLGLHWPEVGWGTLLTGGIDEGFTPEQTVIKEIHEETGYKNIRVVRDLGLIHSKYYHAPKKINRFGHASTFYVELVDNEKDTVSIEETTKHEINWLTKDELKKFLTAASHLQALELLEKTLYTGAGLLANSGEFNGSFSDEAKQKITEFVGGKNVKKYKIKDWVFSRQRYWGEPIPIIHCADCGAVPVPENELPLLLPSVDSYEPTGTGESPLADITDWVNTTCPTCGKPAKRETNTMPQWAGSSWYYLRYIDPKNNNALVDLNKEKDWMPVDVYVGGDHATRHLIYARFWHKFLFDIGVVSGEEPFPRLEFLGFILAEDGRKMSKRWKNVVNPDDVVNIFGADAFRLYEMFIGPFEATACWNNDGMVGTRRFLDRVWRFVNKNLDNQGASDKDVQKIIHKTIKKVSADIEAFKFNTAVSQMMICLNEFEKSDGVSVRDIKIFLQLLAPFAPHMTEELWHILGEQASVHVSDWPKYDESKIIDTEFTIAVQVNGKVRDEIVIGADVDDEEVKQMSIASDKVQKWIAGGEVKKVIYIKNKLVSIVL